MVPDDLAGVRHGEVVPAEVQHVGVGGECDVGTVVDGHQFSVPAAGVGRHLEQREFLTRLEVLVA